MEPNRKLQPGNPVSPLLSVRPQAGHIIRFVLGFVVSGSSGNLVGLSTQVLHLFLLAMGGEANSAHFHI
jgi:hypothetical protein